MAQIEVDFDSEDDKRKLFAVLKQVRGKCVVSIDKPTTTRSHAQNKYYWGVIIPMMACEFGYFRDEMHELLRRKFLSYTKLNPVTGELETFAKSTTKLSVGDMEVYMENIRTWALSEFNVLLPLPNEVLAAIYGGS